MLWGFVPLESHAVSADNVYEGFSYTISSGKAHIWGYNGGRDVVIVPGKIEKKPVVSAELYDIRGKSISFRQCTQLKSIDAERINYDRIDLAKTSSLQTLSIIESGQVTNLSLSACKQLKKLQLEIPSLQKLTVSSNKLKELVMSNTKVASLSLSKCTALKDIDISGTELKTLTLGKIRSLKTVNVESNKLKSLNISGCTEIAELNFSYNSGMTVNISKNPKLKLLTYSPWLSGGSSVIIKSPLKKYPYISRYTNK
jgi:hypothetical protein